MIRISAEVKFCKSLVSRHCLFSSIPWINILTLLLKVRSSLPAGLFQLISFFFNKFTLNFFSFSLQLLLFRSGFRRLSDPPHQPLLHLLGSQVFQPAFIWAFFFSAHIYLSPTCCINSFEEEYHFQDERSAVLMCKQTRQKFEMGKYTYKELCFIDEPFTKESIFKAPKPLIPPAQRILCVCVYVYFIYLLIHTPDSGCSFGFEWVYTLCASSHHTVAHGDLYCVCVCVFLTQTHFNKFTVIHFLFTQGSSLQICLNRGSIGLPPLNNWCLLLLSQSWLKSQNIHWLE